MGFRSRRAVRRLAGEMGAEAKRCWASGRCGFEKLEARFEYRGYLVRLAAGRRVSIDMRGFKSSVAFALGAPDLVCLATQQRDAPPLLAKAALFVNPQVPSTAIDWLADEGNARTVAALECSRREPLFVWYEQVVAVVRPARATTSMLALVAELATRLAASPPLPEATGFVDGLRLDPDPLPPELRPLVPLIEEWAIGDDLRRKQRLDAATPEDRDRLRRIVGPLMDRIDAYLDSFDPRQVPEGAALVGRLAEAVAELGVSDPQDEPGSPTP